MTVKNGVVFLAWFAFSCSSGVSGSAVTALRGVVTSSAGEPLSGVTVKSEDASARTDEQGVYLLRTAAGRHTVRFVASGFLEVQRSLEVLDGRLTMQHVVMLPLAPAQPLNLGTGGTVSMASGLSLEAPAGAFVSAAGQSMSGMAQVRLTAIAANDSVTARSVSNFVTTLNGQRQLLESFGMADIEVKVGSQRLQIATGKTLALSLPSTASNVTAPLSWSFDNVKGEWVQEPVAVIAQGQAFTLALPHLSMWNVDKPYETACVSGRVLSQATKKPLPGASIETTGVSYSGASSAQSGASGEFVVFAKVSSSARVSVTHGFGGGVSKEVSTGSTVQPVVPDAELISLLDPRKKKCVSIGDIEVIEDPWQDDSNSAGVLGCSNLATVPSCVEALEKSLRCYAPEGACTLSFSPDAGTVYAFENGVRDVNVVNGTEAVRTVYGTDGQQCFQQSSTLASTENVSTFEVPGQGTYTFSISGDGVRYVCPDGVVTQLTVAQARQFSECRMQPQAPRPEDCTVELPGTCRSSMSCTSPQVCCIESPQLAICRPAQDCAASDAGVLP